ISNSKAHVSRTTMSRPARKGMRWRYRMRPLCESSVMAQSRPRVLHFVTGGFSGGATQVAIQLVNAGVAGGRVDPLLVLRRKRRGDPARIRELAEAGTPLRVVPGWSH